MLHQKNIPAISVEGRGLPLEHSRMDSKRTNFSPLLLPFHKMKEQFIGRHGEGAENTKKYREIDVTSKTPAKQKQ